MDNVWHFAKFAKNKIEIEEPVSVRMYKNQADYIITKCGGVKVVMDWLSQPYHTVWGWVNRSTSGHIPAEHQGTLIEKARAAGIEITERELIFPPLEQNCRESA